MGRTDAEKKAQQKYAQKFQRPAIYMTAEKLEKVKAHAEAHGESVNAFANRAVDECMQHDNVQGSTYSADSKQQAKYTAGIDADRVLLVELTPQIKKSVEQAAKDLDLTMAEYVGELLSEREAQALEEEELEARGLAVVPVTMSNTAYKRILAAASAAGAKMSDYIAIAATDRAEAPSRSEKPTRRGRGSGKKEAEPQQMELTEAAEAKAVVTIPASGKDDTAELKKRFAEAVKNSRPKASNPEDDIITANQA